MNGTEYGVMLYSPLHPEGIVRWRMYSREAAAPVCEQWRNAGLDVEMVVRDFPWEPWRREHEPRHRAAEAAEATT